MQFQQRTDVLRNWTATAWGNTESVDIPREFFLEGLIIMFEITYGGTAGTPSYTGDFLAGICDNIRLDVPTGSTIRSPVNASSSMLINWFRQLNGGADRQTVYNADKYSTTGGSTNRVGVMAVPIWFCPPNLDDPVNSFFLLPLPRYSANPTLKFLIAPTGAAPLPFATSNAPTLRYKVLMVRRFVDNPAFPVFDTELNYQDITFNSAGDNQLVELPAPGAFTGMMFQTYQSDKRTTRSAFCAPGTTTGFTSWDKYYELKFLGNTLRRGNPLDLQIMADWGTEIGVAAGGTSGINCGTFGDHVFWWDFLSDRPGGNAQDFGSVLDTNPLIAQGARVQLSASPVNSGDVLRVLYHRVFGDISPLVRKLAPKKTR